MEAKRKPGEDVDVYLARHLKLEEKRDKRDRKIFLKAMEKLTKPERRICNKYYRKSLGEPSSFDAC